LEQFEDVDIDEDFKKGIVTSSSSTVIPNLDGGLLKAGVGRGICNLPAWMSFSNTVSDDILVVNDTLKSVEVEETVRKQMKISNEDQLSHQNDSDNKGKQLMDIEVKHSDEITSLHDNPGTTSHNFSLTEKASITTIANKRLKKIESETSAMELQTKRIPESMNLILALIVELAVGDCETKEIHSKELTKLLKIDNNKNSLTLIQNTLQPFIDDVISYCKANEIGIDLCRSLEKIFNLVPNIE
jgi:hypothetical protein